MFWAESVNTSIQKPNLFKKNVSEFPTNVVV